MMWFHRIATGKRIGAQAGPRPKAVCPCLVPHRLDRTRSGLQGERLAVSDRRRIIAPHGRVRVHIQLHRVPVGIAHIE